MPDYDNAKKWMDFLLSHLPLGYIIPAALIIILIIWPDKVYILISRIQSCFLWSGTWMKKKQIETELKANIIKVSKNISKEIEDVMPYDVKISWVTESNRKAFFDGKEVVVCMNNTNNKMCNLVHAINDYVHNGLLADEKFYVDEKVMKSSCLVLTRKLLLLSYEKGISYFFNEILAGETKEDNELKEKIDHLISLDENGLFTQVMLRELKEKGRRMLGKTTTNEFKRETNLFIDFLYDIAIRNAGENTKLQFTGRYYKTAILLVANYDNYLTYGTESYIKRFQQNVKEGIENIYLCARNNNKLIANKVFEKISQTIELEYFKKFEYIGQSIDGHKFSGICIAIQIKKDQNNKKKVS